jgi:hypothetical protein
MPDETRAVEHPILDVALRNGVKLGAHRIVLDVPHHRLR